MAVAADQIALVLGPMREQLVQAQQGGAEQVAPADLAEAAAALDEMEALAASCADLGEWTTKLAAENWWPRFTEPLTRVLSAVGRAKFARSAGLPDDEALLASTLEAYQSALEGLHGSPEEERIAPVLGQIVGLGRSGLSYPRFLRELEVRGLTSVLAGLVVPRREQLLADAERERAQLDRSRQCRSEALVAALDELTARNPFGAVDPVEWELASTRVEWEWEPRIRRDDALVERARTIFVLLGDWVDSFTARAPADARWAAETPQATRHRLERTRQCVPGFLLVRLGQLGDALGLDFSTLQTDAAFPRARVDFDAYLSDERIELAGAVEPFCRPGGRPPPDLVARAATLF